jgi:hypothetical protein
LIEAESQTPIKSGLHKGSTYTSLHNFMSFGLHSSAKKKKQIVSNELHFCAEKSLELKAMRLDLVTQSCANFPFKHRLIIYPNVRKKTRFLQAKSAQIQLSEVSVVIET